jgi:hypothetical protein
MAIKLNLYLTFDDKSRIKKCFLNLRKYLIISTDEVIDRLGFQPGEIDSCSSFIINEEIKRMIQEGSKGRKLLSIIYSNPRMNDEIIREFIHYTQDLKKIDKVVLLTDKGKNDEYYELFEEVMFFPVTKKVHIIECESYPVAWIGDITDQDQLDLCL